MQIFRAIVYADATEDISYYFYRLTAFISKVFCQAKKVVDDSVEETVHVTPTINWLTTHQNTDGSFTEYNYVNHGPLMVREAHLKMISMS